MAGRPSWTCKPGDSFTFFLVTPEDKIVTPDDPRFTLEAFRFRSILFQWVTIGPHSTWCHGMVAPKLFLDLTRASGDPPAPRVPKPFVFKVHENAGRSNVTVFGKTGVLWNVGAMTPTATQAFRPTRPTARP